MKSKNYVATAHSKRGGAGSGKHHNRTYDVRKGRSRKPKHRKKPQED